MGAWDTLEGAGLQEKMAIRQRKKGPKIQGGQLQGMKKTFKHEFRSAYFGKLSKEVLREAQTLLDGKPPDRSTNKGFLPSPTSPDSSPTCQTGSETPAVCPPEGQLPALHLI